MFAKRKILFAGTTSSGSSALFDYFRCFDNTCALVSELPNVWRKDLFIKWKKEGFKNPEKYKLLLNNHIKSEAIKRFGNKLESSTLLLNNVITCLTLPGIDLIDDITVFCVVRDPRSTWLRRRELCMEYNKKISVEQFIEEYRGQRETFKQYLSYVKKNMDCIHTVNFEDFLLDSNIKNNVVKLAGFDISKYPDNPEYAPYPPEKSILCHLSYSNQHEIELIKSELKEYCHEKV